MRRSPIRWNAPAICVLAWVTIGPCSVALDAAAAPAQAEALPRKARVEKTPIGRTPDGTPVVERKSGRLMEVYTTQPGVQLYTGNRRGFCLETQHYPDSPNRPAFPSTVLRPGETYHEVTIHKFSLKSGLCISGIRPRIIIQEEEEENLGIVAP